MCPVLIIVFVFVFVSVFVFVFAGQEGVVPPPHHVDSGLTLPGLLTVDYNNQKTKPNLVDLHKQDFIDVSLRPTVFGDPLPEAVEQVSQLPIKSFTNLTTSK